MFNVHTVKKVVLTFAVILVDSSGEDDIKVILSADDVEDGIRLTRSFVVHSVSTTVDSNEQLIGTTCDGDVGPVAGDDEMLLFTSAGSGELQAGGVDGLEVDSGGDE